MLPIAHAGHWAIWILYAVPVIVVLGSVVLQLRRERHEDEPVGERSKTDPLDP